MVISRATKLIANCVGRPSPLCKWQFTNSAENCVTMSINSKHLLLSAFYCECDTTRSHLWDFPPWSMMIGNLELQAQNKTIKSSPKFLLVSMFFLNHNRNKASTPTVCKIEHVINKVALLNMTGSNNCDRIIPSLETSYWKGMSPWLVKVRTREMERKALPTGVDTYTYANPHSGHCPYTLLGKLGPNFKLL